MFYYVTNTLHCIEVKKNSTYVRLKFDNKKKVICRWMLVVTFVLNIEKWLSFPDSDWNYSNKKISLSLNFVRVSFGICYWLYVVCFLTSLCSLPFYIILCDSLFVEMVKSSFQHQIDHRINANVMANFCAKFEVFFLEATNILCVCDVRYKIANLLISIDAYIY